MKEDIKERLWKTLDGLSKELEESLIEREYCTKEELLIARTIETISSAIKNLDETLLR